MTAGKRGSPTASRAPTSPCAHSPSAICRDNVRTHGVDNVQVIEGRAPEALVGLEAPDAVFVGGSKGSMEGIIAASLDALRPGGRLVVNAVTLENVGEAYSVLRARRL